MNLKPTRLEQTYEMGDDSGYSFKVVAEWEESDRRLGWKATVVMESHGYVTSEAAVEHLRHSAEAFLRHLGEVKP